MRTHCIFPTHLCLPVDLARSLALRLVAVGGQVRRQLARVERAVEHLRDDVIPATVGRVGGVEANVTGEAAKSLDQDSQLATSLPIVFAFVLVLVGHG